MEAGGAVWLPNMLSALRLLCAPIVVLLVFSGAWMEALAFLIVAAASDVLDGFVARRFGAASEVGVWLDPLADKVLLTSLLVALALEGLAPLWLAMMVLARDAAVFVVVGVDLARGRRRAFFAPLLAGKVNTVVLMLLGLWILGGLALEIEAAAAVGDVLVILAVLTTALSAIMYAALRMRGGAPAVRR